MFTRPGGGSSTTVLVVDDHKGVRLVVDRILTDEGYHVLPAEGPERALQICDEHPDSIDLLVTDIAMPTMTGTALARTLVDRIADLRVLYMSSSSAEAVSLDEFEAGSADFLPKPFGPDELLERVNALLDDPRR